MQYLIRTATADDAAAISQVVITALAESNARDYPPAVIASAQANFGPEQVQALMAVREVLVAEEQGCVIGTASLDGDVVRTVFVVPGAQGRGVGRRLMERVEALAASAASGCCGCLRRSPPKASMRGWGSASCRKSSGARSAPS